jgi:hypothetical protein
MATSFSKLNEGWNADPNSPMPHASVEGKDLLLGFLLNDLMFSDYKNAESGLLRFRDCWRYRIGPPNDEGWYRGQCRFSRLAPAWGEFYEVHGDLLLDAVPENEAFYIPSRNIQLGACPLDWIIIGRQESFSRHFLFYFRDETFECDASDWEFLVKWRLPPA